MRYVDGGKIVLKDLREDENEIEFDYYISVWDVYHKQITHRRNVYGRMRLSPAIGDSMSIKPKDQFKLLKPGKVDPGLHFPHGPVNIKFKVGNRILTMKQAYFHLIGIDDSKDKKYFINHFIGRAEMIIFEKR